MEVKKILEEIRTQEEALLNKSISQADFFIYLKRLASLRSNLFNIIINQNKKIKSLRSTLIGDARQFIQFQCCMLQIVETKEQFQYCINQIVETFIDFREYDKENILYPAICKYLDFALENIRKHNTTQSAYKTNEIYNTLQKIKAQNVQLQTI